MNTRSFEQPPVNPFLDAVNRIVEICVERQAFFEKNPKVLACWMDLYTELSYGSRYLNDYFYETGNPKDALIELEDKKTVSEPYAHLVYDAWGATIDAMSRKERNEKIHPMEFKPNKTMDEYIEMKLDPTYRYNSIYPNRWRVIDHLLCTIGNGYSWNAAGFICDKMPSGTDGDLYLGYEQHKNELPADLQQLEATWRSEPTIAKGLAIQDKVFKKQQAEHRKENKMISGLRKLAKTKKYKELLNDILDNDDEAAYTPQDVYPLCEYSLLVKMPDNAHESYILAGQEICHLLLQKWKFDWKIEKRKFGSQIKESDKKHCIKRLAENRKIARAFLKRFPVNL